MPDDTENKRPWFKFWTEAWRADPGLADCSYAARGLWIELLSLMHESERCGFLLVNGKPASVRSIARRTRGDIAEVEALMAELEANQVFSRDDSGVVYSRKMVRDDRLANKGKVSAEKRWNQEDGDRPNGLPNGAPNGSPNGAGIGSPNEEPNAKRTEDRGQNPPTPQEPKKPFEAVGPDQDGKIADEEVEFAITRTMLSAGMERRPRDAMLARQWLELGADLELDIIKTVRDMTRAHLERKPTDNPASFKFFDAQIRIAIDKGIEERSAYDRQVAALAGGRR